MQSRWLQVGSQRQKWVLAAAAIVAVMGVLALVFGSFPGPPRAAAKHSVAAGTLIGPGLPATSAPASTTDPLKTTTTAPRTTTTSNQAVRGGASTAAPAAPPAAGGMASGTCSAGACVTLDGTRSLGAVDHAGSGFLHGVMPGPNQDGAYLKALDATMYRSSPAVGAPGTYNWSSWDVATSAGAKTTLILSDLWVAKNPDGSKATPWSNWAAYASWVRSTVTSIMASGRQVDYWEVYSEPGWHAQYSAADFANETPADLLKQFQVAYNAIKSVDPSAAIVGPSTGQWSLTPMPRSGINNGFDLGTFLRFAAANNLKLAAVAWHDNSLSPAQVVADAKATWSLIRSLPGLGDPKMFLDEYGSLVTQLIPGWDVGYLAAITDAGIASGVRSCWFVCSHPSLDGLLTSDGQSPTGAYYLRAKYAEMSGQMMSASTTDASVQALGSVDSSKRQIVALIGRSRGCAGSESCNPAYSPSGPSSATSVRVNVVVPWTSSAPGVHLSYQPFQAGGGGSFIPATPSGLTVQPEGSGGELVSFAIPSFADGAAYSVVVSG